MAADFNSDGKIDLAVTDNYASDIAVLINSTTIVNLKIAKDTLPKAATVGYNLAYLITITNDGPDPATNLTLVDTLPAKVDFVSSSSGCVINDGEIKCHIDTLNANDSVTMNVVVRPQEVGTITNTATVTCAEAGPRSTQITTRVYLPGTNLVVKRYWRENPPLVI